MQPIQVQHITGLFKRSLVSELVTPLRVKRGRNDDETILVLSEEEGAAQPGREIRLPISLSQMFAALDDVRRDNAPFLDATREGILDIQRSYAHLQGQTAKAVFGCREP
jgi:hypothetical protein